eukprot:1061862-Pelagomonas_calceolata.AAC.2
MGFFGGCSHVLLDCGLVSGLTTGYLALSYLYSSYLNLKSNLPVHPRALTEFGRQGGAVTLQLDGSSRISLANVTWSEPQQDEFRSGSLTIEGHPPTNGGSKQAVLDAAMRSNLAPIGFKATTLLQVSVYAASACASHPH